MSKSVLKMLISGLKISMSGLKILISGLTISMSGLKPSLFGLKISTSRVRARSQTLAPIFPSGRFITRLLSRPYSKIRSVPAAKCPLPQKGYQKNARARCHSGTQKTLFTQPSNRSRKSGSTPDHFHSPRQTTPQVHAAPRIVVRRRQHGPDVLQLRLRKPQTGIRLQRSKATSRSSRTRSGRKHPNAHTSISTTLRCQQTRRGPQTKRDPNPQKKTLKGVTPRDHRVTTQKAPQNRDKASTTLTHPTTTHTRPLKGGTPHILHLNPSSFRHRSKVCGRGGGGEGKVEPYTTSFQSPLNNCEVSALGKPSSNSCCRHLGIARKRGGGAHEDPSRKPFFEPYHISSHFTARQDSGPFSTSKGLPQQRTAT